MDAVDDDYVVKLPSGDARVMNIDELDAALEAGRIHAGTPVLAPGTTTWMTLGVLAGLDDVGLSASMAPRSPSSMAPMVLDGVDAGGDLDFESFAPKRRPAKIVGMVFGAICVLAVAFGIKSAVSQSIASSAAEAALAAQPAAPPLAAMTIPAPRPPAPEGSAAPTPPKPAPLATPAPATVSKSTAKASDPKKGKLPGAPAAKKKK